MAYLKTLSKVFRKAARLSSQPLQKYRRDPGVPSDVRERSSRWDLERGRRNNRNRWTKYDGLSINSDLHKDLPQLMARCDQEYARNTIFQGIVNTFKKDVVGPHGPKLQIVSDNKEFNAEVERQWKAIFAMPNPARKSSGGVEVMKQWVHLLATAGSYLNVFTEPRRDGLVSFGWKAIHTRRMVTPVEFVGDPNVAFGIRVNAEGEPTKYYLDKPRNVGSQEISGIDYQELRPDQVQHRYIEVEPEQLTGFPMMSSALDTAADIRELDISELNAQRRSAKRSEWLVAQDPSAIIDPEPIAGDTVSASDDEVNVAPLGWMPHTGDNNRPSTNHIEYRRERMAEMGRPIGMPLLMILLSVSDVNFSSAQFGGMLYAECIREVQSFIERLTLNELVEMIILELVISGKVKRPDSYEKTWTHYVPPNANIEKFAKTLRMLVEDGFISKSIATAWLGHDPEEVDAQRQSDNQRADKLEISRPPVNEGKTSKPDTLREVADDLEGTQESEDVKKTVNS